MPITKKLLFIAATMAVVYILSGFVDLAQARSRSGGRSFSRSAPRSTPIRQAPPSQSVRPNSPSPLSSPFARGLTGGLLGGMIGGMLFGGPAHGMGMGGIGGSGIGLIEILLLAGLGVFLFKKFVQRRLPISNIGGVPAFPPNGFDGLSSDGIVRDYRPDDALVEGVKQIWRVDPDFDPEGFKEIAQDLFFKVQAGWTRREVSGLKDVIGDQLLGEYARYFEEMKQQGRTNRLENIAVRRVELVDAGVEQGEIFVGVRFTANLLDYTVDETGTVISGDPHRPVKFEEVWTFARPVGRSGWKLEGIVQH